MTKTPNNKLGDYELIRRISDGAQASVYEARSEHSGGTVALKLFKNTGEDDSAEMRFQREADILRNLSHRNIVRYKDSFSTAGDWEERQNCLVMEFMAGETLKERLKKYPKGMPWKEAKDILEQCLSGLIYAREKHGITHRDLKPSNIFIMEDGQVRLFDFGIARMDGSATRTGGGACMGSFDYMAPDFALADRFTAAGDAAFRGDHISDIFSLTVCFYEMLTGRVPWRKFGERPELEYLTRWRTEKPKPPSLSPIVFRVIRHLTGFINKGLDPDRSARFQDFPEMLEALRDLRPRIIKHKGTDEYQLIEGLDKGGFGEVYKAQRVRDGKTVAIKRLFADRATRRFVKEAEVLRKYFHPHLVEYVDFFQNVSSSGSKQLFLVMEYLDGMPQWSLRNRIKDSGAMDIGEALELFRYYLEALQYLHENVNQIIHRDIKPGNLYAPKDNAANAKILDLGVARDVSGTQTHGATPGTWDYMAPEFVTENSRGTRQSDIYALGLSLYEAVTGTHAFPRTSKSGQEAAADYVARATGKKKVVMSFDYKVFQQYPALEKIIRQSTHENPEKRFAGAAEMQKEILLLLKEMGRLDGWEIEDLDETSITAGRSAETCATQAVAPQAALSEQPTQFAGNMPVGAAGQKSKRSVRKGVIVLFAVLAAAAGTWLAARKIPPHMIRPAPPPASPPQAVKETAVPTTKQPAAQPATVETIKPPPVVAEDRGNTAAGELVKDLRLLRMRNIVAASYDVFFEDAAARADNAKLIISQPEYDGVRGSQEVRKEERRLWQHIAENAIVQYQKTKDGRFLSAARGALHAASPLYKNGRTAGSCARILQDWNEVSTAADFNRFLPLPQTETLAANMTPKGTQTVNAYLEALLETADFSAARAAMLPHVITIRLHVPIGNEKAREANVDFVLVPEGKAEIGEIPHPYYLAKTETTFGTMRCYRDGAQADIAGNPDLQRYFTGKLGAQTLQNNNSPYQLQDVSEAIEFCNWLSHRQGFKPVYSKETGSDGWTADVSADGFRLPTETEWEYAARFGLDWHPAAGKMPWKRMEKELDANHADDLVWFYYKNEPRDPAASGAMPYPLGMFDMCGNMGEIAMKHAEGQEKDRLRLSVCGGSFKKKTAEKVMPWAKEDYASAENVGFRPVLPVRIEDFLK